MFEFVASVFALGIVAQIVFWIVAVALFPLFWLWMLVDAALRPESAYPTAGSSEKIVWVVLLVVFQIVSIVYFFMVYRAGRSGASDGPVGTGADPSPATVPPTPSSAPPMTPVAPTAGM